MMIVAGRNKRGLTPDSLGDFKSQDIAPEGEGTFEFGYF